MGKNDFLLRPVVDDIEILQQRILGVHTLVGAPRTQHGECTPIKTRQAAVAGTVHKSLHLRRQQFHVEVQRTEELPIGEHGLVHGANVFRVAGEQRALVQSLVRRENTLYPLWCLNARSQHQPQLATQILSSRPRELEAPANCLLAIISVKRTLDIRLSRKLSATLPHDALLDLKLSVRSLFRTLTAFPSDALLNLSPLAQRRLSNSHRPSNLS